MEWLVVLVFVSLIPALVASNKGRSFAGWWIYALLLWPIALIHSLVITTEPEIKAKQGLRRGSHLACPFCAETIRAEAVVCRYCGRDLPQVMASRNLPPSDPGQCSQHSNRCKGKVLVDLDDGQPRCTYHRIFP